MAVLPTVPLSQHQLSRNVRLVTVIRSAMVRVGSWRSLALLVLCHSQHTEASVSIFERNAEPTTFVTSSATLNSGPVWLVLPMLLDVQPVLLKVDVTRHVPAQVQSFCREHGVNATRCEGAIREALEEVVNFQMFCKKPTAESALPGFIVTKNVLIENAEAASASWWQNDPEDVAIDFCGFAQAKAGEKCAEALEKALHLSFEWMLALSPCEQQAKADDAATASDSETSSFAERLATVEEMIAALQTTSSVTQEETVNENPSAEGGSIEEISAESTGNNGLEGNVDQLRAGIERAGLIRNEYDAGQDSAAIREEISLNSSERLSTDAHEGLQQATDAEIFETLAKKIGVNEGGITDTNGSCEGSSTPSRIGEDVDSQKSWKVGAALVLALSILYVAVDLVLHCVHFMAGHLGAPKQLARVVLHDILLLLGGGPGSTFKLTYKGNTDGNTDVKKPSTRRSKVASSTGELKPKREVKSAEQKTLDGSLKVQETPHHPSPSFTCVAMMLSITNDSIALPHDTQSFVQDSNEALRIIQNKYQQELTAAQRIQKAWKTAQCKVLLKHDWTTFSNATAEKSDSNTPIYRPAGTERVTTNLRRFVPTPLPPR
ncbi:hypothetical protein GN244_ATG09420 [Phytophthora infestans]|uniref:Uncharacterized protein n=1 Tax=Phytophthora infestans TaxID=4787 RepID=A0A833W1I0_PHYIN|nr:hypothetical protein GN244_ATG09420 [Phytophthora infestans]